MIRSVHHFAALFLFGVLQFLGGCSSYTDLPPGTVQKMEGSSVIERQLVTHPPLAEQESPSLEYRVGPGDVLFVNVSGRPEMGSPVAGTSGQKVAGSRVDGSGHIHLPMVGSVEVRDLTIAQIQQKLEELYRTYLNNSWVVVEVAEFKSQPVYLLGQFKTAGTFYLDRPLTLLQGLALGGGLTDSANLRSARLIREGKTLPVDLRELIEDGGAGQNTWLRSGDTIFIPDDRNQNVFVFGAVTKPGPVPMPNGQLNLPQALAAAGAGEVRGQLGYVRIIRSLSTTRGELIVVDVNRSLQGKALPFVLTEGDIVYVPRSAVGNWNQAISEILPSLQAVSAILQPFVQIQFLREDN